MRVARLPSELEPVPRAVAIGTFDGVHLGHRRVVEAALAAGKRPTVVTFHPHPRTILGNRVELLATVERRLELLAALGVQETLVLEFTQELARTSASDFAEGVLRAIGAEVVVAGPTFRFGRAARGDLALLGTLGFDVRPVPLTAEASSSTIRKLLHAGSVREAASLLGRPPELEGTVVLGDQRGGTLGFPTANLSVEPDLLVPAYGIYAGAAAGHRAAISIGTNPHYGGADRRVEAFLLDFEGDLYGRRLVVELWERLRAERAFGSESELVAAIADDVDRARRATSPVAPGTA
jgi:riboflavin kinase / FMN adenylyltransferase